MPAHEAIYGVDHTMQDMSITSLPRYIKLDKCCAKTDHGIKVTVSQLEWLDLQINDQNT